MLRALILLMLVLMSSWAHAHESRPMYVEITERAEQAFEVSWRIPPSALNTSAPFVTMPGECKAAAEPSGTHTYKRQFFQCQSNLSEKDISIVWPNYNPSISTLFRLQRLSGETHSKILPPDRLTWTVPLKENTWSIAQEYLVLGVEHILLGFDHLLFVACLILIAGSLKRILITVTGFTIAHSITLSLAALGVVQVPVPAVEAVIALSIVFLAVEIARNRRNSLAWRYPVLVASTFGLLHGFGFASVLSDIGLPQTEIPVALLFFNVGVEIGQIIFIVACVILFWFMIKLGILKQGKNSEEADAMPQNALNKGFVPADWIPASVLTVTVYAVGTISSYWMITRFEAVIA
jgi:hydrogenase/urease accessory protein HupE